MKRSDREPLLKELLTDESLEALRLRSVDQGLAVVRRRKQHAAWAKGGLMVGATLGALWLVVSLNEHPRLPDQVGHRPLATNAANSTPPVTTMKTPAPVRFISDDELLALFPGRPLALIGPPGRKTLLFLDQPPTTESDDHRAGQ